MSITNATPNTAANVGTGQTNLFNATQTFASAVSATDEHITFTAHCVFSAGGTFTRCGMIFNLPNDTSNVRNKACSYTNCHIRFAQASNWNKVALSTLTNCLITGTGNSASFPLLSSTSAWNNVTLASSGQIVFDTDASVSAFNGVRVIDNNGGFWQQSTGGVTAYGLAFEGSTPSSMWVSAGSGTTNLINSYTVLFARTRINSSAGMINYKATRNILSTASAKLAAWDKNQAAAYTATADANGLFAELVVTTHTPSTWTNGSVGTVVFDEKLAGSGYSEILYKYGYALLRTDVASHTSLRLGTPAPQNNGSAISIPVPLTADALVTLTEANAAALDGTVFSLSGSTITATITGTKTADDLYDWLHWKTRALIPSVTRGSVGGTLTVAELATGSAGVLNLNALNLTVTSGTLAAGTKLSQLLTTASITTSGSGAISCGYQDTTGKRIILSGWPTGTTAEDGNSRNQVGVLFETDSNWAILDRANNNIPLTVNQTTGAATATVDPAKKYVLVADAHGYYRSAQIHIDPSTLAAFSISIEQIARADGSAQFDGSHVAAHVAAFSWDNASNEIYTTSGAGGPTTISYQSFLVASEQLFTSNTAIIQDRPKPVYDFENQTVFFPAGSTYHLCDAPTNTQRVTLTFSVLRVGAGVHDAYCVAWESLHGLAYPTTYIAAPAQVLATAERAAIATATRSELATELGRIDATVSSRLSSAGYTTPPTAAANATAVRSELATELARVDVAVSSRNATAPDNAGVAAIKAKTDNLPSAPAAVSDVQAVGSAVSALTIPSAATTAAAVRTELAAELARVDTTISSRSTLTAGDIPEGLTAADVWGYGSRSLTVAPSSLTASDVWSYATRTLSVAAGLTPAQEAKLDDIAAKTVNLPQTPAASSEVSAVAAAVAALSYPTAATLAAEIAPSLNSTLTAARATETIVRAANPAA